MAIMDRSMEGKRQYTTGISKGVFFGEDGKAFPWNGLISVTEKPQANAPTPVYNSLGEKYDQFGNIAEKKHSLTCYTYPEEMDEFLGIEYLEEMGYSVDERPPKKFSMAYRTELGDGLYEIHVLLNQIATFADTAKNTITNNITPTVVTMNLEGVPDPRIKTSHIILDSRLPLTESAERLLFGNNMVDGNINEFLDAEPTWVTVATNYAPIIEPDYDNMVWLGGENLLRNSMVEVTNTDYQILKIDFVEGHGLVEGDEYTITVDATLSPDVGFLNFHNSQSTSPEHRWSVITTGQRVTLSATKTFRSFEGDTHLLFYATPSGRTLPSTIHSVKLERGSTATPWTPAPEDNYVPPSDQPRPANYVPGVKNSQGWDSRGRSDRNSIVYYDETSKSLALYSTRTRANENTLAVLTRVWRDIPLGPTMRFTAVAELKQDMTNSNQSSSIGFASPHVAAGIPTNTAGIHHVDVKGSLSDNQSNKYIRIQHGGMAGSEPILIRDMYWRLESSPVPDFFDVYTNPKTKGDRYVRITDGVNGDYTEYQQLILQSKSRVILSDITQHQYTLEASDSQLSVSGPTFTFKGPQATPVGDDQFTIDDEIYGEE